MLLREADDQDGEMLLEALYFAVNWSGPERISYDELLADPHLSSYVASWPLAGDFGIVALDAGLAVGAAWARMFNADTPGYGWVADDIPELTIGVAPALRGRGVGTALLAAVIAEAVSRGHDALSLSVEDGNRARALYERAGFTKVGRCDTSDTLLLQLSDGAANR